MKELQIVIRNQSKGREATPWLDPYRKRFTEAAEAASLEMKDTKLKGADRVRAFNRLISQKLNHEEAESP